MRLPKKSMTSERHKHLNCLLPDALGNALLGKPHDSLKDPHHDLFKRVDCLLPDGPGSAAARDAVHVSFVFDSLSNRAFAVRHNKYTRPLHDTT